MKRFSTRWPKGIDFREAPKGLVRPIQAEDSPKAEADQWSGIGRDKEGLSRIKRYWFENNHRNCWMIEEDVSSIEGAVTSR